eukprot:6707022-Heterocapsa_arctica.AAC.1
MQAVLTVGFRAPGWDLAAHPVPFGEADHLHVDPIAGCLFPSWDASSHHYCFVFLRASQGKDSAPTHPITIV